MLVYQFSFRLFCMPKFSVFWFGLVWFRKDNHRENCAKYYSNYSEIEEWKYLPSYAVIVCILPIFACNSNEILHWKSRDCVVVVVVAVWAIAKVKWWKDGANFDQWKSDKIPFFNGCDSGTHTYTLCKTEQMNSGTASAHHHDYEWYITCCYPINGSIYTNTAIGNWRNNKKCTPCVHQHTKRARILGFVHETGKNRNEGKKKVVSATTSFRLNRLKFSFDLVFRPHSNHNE